MSNATQTRVAELQTVLAAKVALLDEGLNDPNVVQIKGDNMEISPENWTKFQGLRQEADQIKSLIQSMGFTADTKGWLDSPAGSGSQTIGGGHQDVKRLPNDIGAMFLDSQEFKDMKAAKSLKSMPFEMKAMDISGYGQKDVYGQMTGTSIGAHQFGTIQFDPMVPRPQRQFRVRDLFPAVATDATTIDYFRVLGYTGTSGVPGILDPADHSGAASVPDRTSGAFSLKPKSNLGFDSQQAPVRTIAHWEAAHRNVLDDAPQLQGTINNELLYGLRLEEDRQILQGSGANDELQGILTTSGVQAYTQTSAGNPAAATEQKADALRRASTKAIISNYQSTGFVLNPYDWQDVELQKGTGDGQYMLVTNVAVGAQAQVWRQPVVETVAMPQYTFLCGAFGLGAQLYDRQEANIRISESHADFFVRNAIVILCEERLALAVKRPEAFVVGTFFH